MKLGAAIYLDHQATTPLDARVFTAIARCFEDNIANPHSAEHALGWKAEEAVAAAASEIGALIGADRDEIIFTSGATESNNLALLGLGRYEARGKRRRILVSSIEHKCVLAASRALNVHYGYQVEFLDVDRLGRLDFAALNEKLDEDVLLVSVMAVNNEIGTIQDIEEIAATVHRHGAYFHCDAAQAPCAIELKSASVYCDLLSLSAHKMYGPKGIGVLFIRRDLHERIEPLIYGGGQQHNLRSGTVPVPLCVGMGVAASLLTKDEGARERHILRERQQLFLRGLENLPYQVMLNGPRGSSRHPGNINVQFCGFSALDILSSLQPHLAASTGSACTSGIPEPSHVLRAIGLSASEMESSIRFSIGRQTTETDLSDALKLIETSLADLASTGLAQLG